MIHVAAWTEKDEKSGDLRLPERTRKLFFPGNASARTEKQQQQEDAHPASNTQEQASAVKEGEEDTDVFVGPGTARVHKSPLKEKDTAKASEKKHKRVRFVED